MRNFLQLKENEMQLVYNRLQTELKLPAQAIEKDFWVTVILQAIFSLPIAQHLVFKGGTSLSKAWNLIDRFSEDIDLALNPEALGLEQGDMTKKQIKKLRKASSIFVSETFSSQLIQRLTELGLPNWLSVEVQPDGVGDNTYPEPRQIYITYRSVVANTFNYIRPIVVLEIGARSLIEPTEAVDISSMLSQVIPLQPICSPKIVTAIPAKTFLEKVFLLHELFSIEGHGMQANRKSRHLYDLWKMMDKPFAIAAIHNDNLWETIRHHREIFTSVSGMDYSLDIRKNLTLVPREDIRANWESDYESMSSAMIYGDKPTFDALCDQMRVLQERFKQ